MMRFFSTLFLAVSASFVLAACGGGGAGAGNALAQPTDGTAAISAVVLTVN